MKERQRIMTTDNQREYRLLRRERKDNRPGRKERDDRYKEKRK